MEREHDRGPATLLLLGFLLALVVAFGAAAAFFLLDGDIRQITGAPVTFTAPADGGRPLPPDQDPFAPGGELAGTGILQLPPDEAHRRLMELGLRVSWRVTIDQYTYGCVLPPPGTIQQDMGGLIGGDGEVIIFVIPPSILGVTPPVPQDCS